MTRQPIRYWPILLWSTFFTAIGLAAFHQVQKSTWYQDRVFQKLVNGEGGQRLAAASTLAQLGAEDYLLRGLKSDEPEVREVSRRGLEHIWFVAAGRKAFDMNERAIDAMDEGRYAEALELLNQLVARYPDYAEGWNRRASLYWEIGEYEKSIADCQRVLSLNPNHYGAWQGIGVCQLQLGNLAAACESLRTVLKILPHDEATRRSLRNCEDLLRLYPPPNPYAQSSILL